MTVLMQSKLVNQGLMIAMIYSKFVNQVLMIVMIQNNKACEQGVDDRYDTK